MTEDDYRKIDYKNVSPKQQDSLIKLGAYFEGSKMPVMSAEAKQALQADVSKDKAAILERIHLVEQQLADLKLSTPETKEKLEELSNKVLYETVPLSDVWNELISLSSQESPKAIEATKAKTTEPAFNNLLRRITGVFARKTVQS